MSAMVATRHDHHVVDVVEFIVIWALIVALFIGIKGSGLVRLDVLR